MRLGTLSEPPVPGFGREASFALRRPHRQRSIRRVTAPPAPADCDKSEPPRPATPAAMNADRAAQCARSCSPAEPSSGTGCDGIAQEHTAPLKLILGAWRSPLAPRAECSSAVAALYVSVYGVRLTSRRQSTFRLSVVLDRRQLRPRSRG
jgi:hypothetical protein